MKTHLKTYSKADMKGIVLKNKDKPILEDFLTLCRGNCGDRKLKNINRAMLQIYDTSELSFDEWDLKNLRSFIAVLNASDKRPATINDIKKILKRFLKEHYEDWSKRFKGFDDNGIKCKDEVNHKKINPKTILTDSEFKEMIELTGNPKYLAWLLLSWESACRFEEGINLKWSGLDLENGEVTLHSSKTGKTRVNPLHESLIYLKRYKKEYPYPNLKKDDYVFVSPNDRSRPLSSQSIGTYLNKLGEKMNKKIFPYLIRHTKLSMLMKSTLSSKSYENFADHSIATANKYYGHLDKNDLRDEMFEKVFKIEEFSEETKIDLQKQIDKLTEQIKEHKYQTALVLKKVLDGKAIVKETKDYFEVDNIPDYKFKSLEEMKEAFTKKYKG